MQDNNSIRPRPKETENEINEKGEFVRQENRFTTPFGDEEENLKAEAGRYRLIWAKGCNWSNRASIVRELLGLDDVISVNLVGKAKTEHYLGWEFVYDENNIDPVLGTQYLTELYANGDPAYKGRATVPALVDVKTKKVVNNDYHWLTNYFERDFAPFHKDDAPDLYPEEIRDEIDEFNKWLFNNVNNGVYKMMFAQSIEAYEDTFKKFYEAMDKLEERLENQRFLFGDYITDSDVRFYVTLARFDLMYFRNLGPIRNRIVDFKNIWAYARDLYEEPAFKNNTYFKDLAERHGDKTVIFIDYSTRFWDKIDYQGLWSEPQNRKFLSKTPNEKFIAEVK
ncbi:glutathione S-transferase C-terminal domain-containing protein [Clostridium paraputrificum]|uniref:glutathione S-transferase C-terminal domain-containing protein n=1 Tax=Clostridium paraputrificum TaxID=29363 RepID=UPI003D34FC6D